MLSFGAPLAFLALPLPLLVWRFMPPYRETMPALRFPFFRQVVDETGVTAAPGAVVRGRSLFQMAVAGFIWLMLVLAIAQPQRLGAPVETTRSARDLILAIDISGSMDARDFAGPDQQPVQRLAAVRDVVRDFVARREGDRMALIVFGSRAYLQTPLTEDRQAILDLLDQTTVGMAGPHTAIGDAIGLSIRTFEASEVEQRLLVLLSDGTDTASRMSPVNAAEIARGAGIEIHTIAVGNPAASGENRVDVAALQDIATRTGGTVSFASDQSALEQIYDSIDRLAPRLIETLSYRPRESLQHLPLLLALLAGLGAVAWMLLRRLRRGRG